MSAERRAGGEVRVAGRTLTGTAMRYGDVSPDFRERFEPGAFGEVRPVPLNLQHDSGIVLAPAVSLTNSPEALRVRATLPEGSGVLALVRRRALSAFSVEFKPTREHRDAAGVRVVERATLTGLALVDRGAYPGATAEVRARSGRTLRSSIPYDRDLACECIAQGRPASECVPLAKFAAIAGVDMERLIAEAFASAQRGELGPDVLAVQKDYSRPLASARRGTLRAADGDDRLAVEIDLPTGAAGDGVVDAHAVAGVIVRPLIDEARSQFADGPDGREYTKPQVRAFLVGSTDARAGWPEPEIIATPVAVPALPAVGDVIRPVGEKLPTAVDKAPPILLPGESDPDPEGRSAPRRRRVWL